MVVGQFGMGKSTLVCIVKFMMMKVIASNYCDGDGDVSQDQNRAKHSQLQICLFLRPVGNRAN